MSTNQRPILFALTTTLTLLSATYLSLTLAFGADPTTSIPSDQPADKTKPVTVEVARDRAKVMHQVYSATLEVMHRHYFHENKAVLPARAMEDVFAEMGDVANIKARWIAVNTKAMSINHEPKTDFERQAAAAIAAGKEEFERIDDGVYRRAGVIPLASGCVSCHAGFLTTLPKTPRFAGLVISMPVADAPAKK